MAGLGFKSRHHNPKPSAPSRSPFVFKVSLSGPTPIRQWLWAPNQGDQMLLGCSSVPLGMLVRSGTGVISCTKPPAPVTLPGVGEFTRQAQASAMSQGLQSAGSHQGVAGAPESRQPGSVLLSCPLTLSQHQFLHL